MQIPTVLAIEVTDPDPDSTGASLVSQSPVSPRSSSALPLRRYRRYQGPAAGIIAASLALTGCANGTGAPPEEEADRTGYAFGADQEEVDQALEELAPVEITYQPSAGSPNSILSPNGTDIKEFIEERSGGKITVEVVWGQAIADYTEIDDALADGRVDLAFTLPSYTPSEYPAFDAIGTAMSTLPSSPVIGDLVTNAAGVEAAWETPAVLEEYEAKNLEPLIPLLASGEYYSLCSGPLETGEDWQGKQMRIGSAAAGAQVTELGASPVSLSFPETYEALQRGTVDCDLGQLAPNVEAGTFEVAPHIGYATDAGFARSAGAYVAGATYRDLPVAYQQVIFDSMSTAFSTMMNVVIGAKPVAVEDAKSSGGTVAAFDSAVQESLAEHAQQLTAETAETAGDHGIPQRLQVSAGTWQQRITGLGYADEGDFADIDSWYPEDADYRDLGDELFTEVMFPHRPGTES